jgi:hypothetical protein
MTIFGVLSILSFAFHTMKSTKVEVRFTKLLCLLVDLGYSESRTMVFIQKQVVNSY